MQALDLYGTIEEYLDFHEEVRTLYSNILEAIIDKDISTIIDIGCGQGDFCVLLGINGFQAYGVDLSQKQIEIAKKKDIDVECIDIKDVKKKFQCATATFDVLNYIPPKELQNFIQSTYDLLEENGYFVFDFNTLFGFEEIAQGTLSLDLEEKFIVIDANFDSDVLYTDMTVFTQENELYNKQSGTIEQYYHPKSLFIKIFKEVGFEVVDLIDVYLHNDEEADKQIFLVKKGK